MSLSVTAKPEEGYNVRPWRAEVVGDLRSRLANLQPKKLPNLRKALGRGMAEFKKATEELKAGVQREVAFEERQQKAPRTKGSVHDTKPLEKPAEG